MPSPRAGPSSAESAPDVGMTKEPSDSTVKRSLQAQLAMPESTQRRGNPPNPERQWPKQKPPADRRGQSLGDWEPRKRRKWYSRRKKDFPIQVLVTGQIGDCGSEFLQRVSDYLPKINLKAERFRGDSGHFLLVFCPVVSRVGTDMQNALEHLQGESKAILVMLHHRPKEYDHFLDTKLQAQHPAVVCTVHARYTLEDGLYGCQVNKEAVAAVAKILKIHCKKMTKEHSNPKVKPSPQAQLALPENNLPRGTMPDSASQQAETHRLEKKQKRLGKLCLPF